MCYWLRDGFGRLHPPPPSLPKPVPSAATPINPGVDLTQLKHDTLFKSARSALSNGRLPFRGLDRAGGEFRHFSRADGVIIPRERDIHPSWNDFGYG